MSVRLVCVQVSVPVVRVGLVGKGFTVRAKVLEITVPLGPLADSE